MSFDAVNERPGGRNAKVRESVHRAVLELIARKGPRELTIVEISELSGVSRSTIHRRWGTVSGILTDIAIHDAGQDQPLPDTGNLGDDLQLWVRRIVESLNSRPAARSPFGAAVFQLIQTAASPDDSPFLFGERLQAMQMVLDHAAARGQQVLLDSTALAEIVVMPIYFWYFTSASPLQISRAEKLVTRFLTLNSATAATP